MSRTRSTEPSRPTENPAHPTVTGGGRVDRRRLDRPPPSLGSAGHVQTSRARREASFDQLAHPGGRQPRDEGRVSHRIDQRPSARHTRARTIITGSVVASVAHRASAHSSHSRTLRARLPHSRKGRSLTPPAERRSGFWIPPDPATRQGTRFRSATSISSDVSSVLLRAGCATLIRAHRRGRLSEPTRARFPRKAGTSASRPRCSWRQQSRSLVTYHPLPSAACPARGRAGGPPPAPAGKREVRRRIGRPGAQVPLAPALGSTSQENVVQRPRRANANRAIVASTH